LGVKFINVVLSPEPLKITIMKLKKIFSTPQRFFAIGSLTLALLIGFASCKKENFLTCFSFFLFILYFVCLVGKSKKCNIKFYTLTPFIN
jgi:hypothetical protein